MCQRALEQLPAGIGVVPPAPWRRERRHLFEPCEDNFAEDRGRLVHDTVLLDLETRLPQEGWARDLPGLTTPVLLDWVADPDFGWLQAHRGDHVAWAPLAAACREAVIIEGRGARVALPPFSSEAASLRAMVYLASGAVCSIYRQEASIIDGVVAVLSSAPGSEVVEVRYRGDESVEVVLADDGGRIVKRPRHGLVLHKSEASAAGHTRRGPRPPVRGVGSVSEILPPHLGGAVYDASDGSQADAWLRGQGASAAAPTAWVRPSPSSQGAGPPTPPSSPLEPAGRLPHIGSRSIASPPSGQVVATRSLGASRKLPLALATAVRMLADSGAGGSARRAGTAFAPLVR